MPPRGAAPDAGRPRASTGDASARPDWTDVVFRPDLHAAPVQRAPEPSPREAPRASDPGPSPGAGQPLPDAVRARMESSMGADFSAVRVHEGPRASALGAVAFTQGADIHFAPGRYDPGSGAGAELLGHELAHVVQQSEGRVAATGQAKPADGDGAVPLNDDPGLEREADEMGARAARGEPARAAGAATGGPARAADAAIQRYRDYQSAPGKPTTDGGKLQHKGSYHIKFHPCGGKFQGQVFDEFHVTFELFDDDKLCPKIYFDDSGKRLAHYDNTQTNKRYKSEYAGKEDKPSFDELIEAAALYATGFLDDLPYLDENAALELVEERRQQEEKRAKRKLEEDERLHDKREEQEEKHSGSMGTTYSKEKFSNVFGNQLERDEKDEILAEAGLGSHPKRVLFKKIMWDDPKEAWDKHGYGKEYEALQLARAKRESSKSKRDEVEESSTSEDVVTNTNTNSNTNTTANDELNDAKREVEEKDISPRELTLARDKLEGVDNSDKPTDTTELARRGLSGPVIALIVAIGLGLFWQLLRVLGIM